MSERKRRPRRVPREVFHQDAKSPYQAPLCEYRADVPVSQFITPDGVIAYTANDIPMFLAFAKALGFDIKENQ